MSAQSLHPPTIAHRIASWAALPSAKPTGPNQACRILLRVLLITGREFHKNELALRASALTYTIILSLVPLLAMSTALIKGIGGGNNLQQIVYEYIDNLDHKGATTVSIPAPKDSGADVEVETSADSDKSSAPLTAHLRSAADKLFSYVDKTDFTTLGSIGVLLMLITVTLLFDTIEKAMNTIWHVQAGRSPLRKVTDYLSLLLLMPLAINIGFAATTILKSPALLARTEPFLPVISLQPLFLLLLPILFITLALAISYMVFPNTKVRPIPAFIGAILAGSLWFITQNIVISLQIGVSNYNAIYGSFATLPLFLIWLYLGWIFILTGAQVAFACQTHHSFQLKPLPSSPAEQLSAAFDILQQVFLFFNRQQTLTAATLPDLCPKHPPHLLALTVDQLLAAGIIHTQDKQQHLFPTLPAEQLYYSAIVKAMLGTDTPDTEGGEQSRLAIAAASQALPQNFHKNRNESSPGHHQPTSA